MGSLACSNADEKLVAALCAPPSVPVSQRRSDTLIRSLWSDERSTKSSIHFRRILLQDISSFIIHKRSSYGRNILRLVRLGAEWVLKEL